MSQTEPNDTEKDTGPAQLPALQRAQELRAEGKSLRVIAGILEAEGVPTPGRVKKWSHKAVARLFDPPGPSTTPGPAPAPVEIPAPADAVLTRLAGQIAELEELNEEREALDREARGQLAEGQEVIGQRIADLARLAELEKQQQAQRAEQTAEWERVAREWQELWQTRWGRWLAANWRRTLVPFFLGVLFTLVGLGVWNAGLVNWVLSLFR